MGSQRAMRLCFGCGEYVFFLHQIVRGSFRVLEFVAKPDCILRLAMLSVGLRHGIFNNPTASAIPYLTGWENRLNV